MLYDFKGLSRKGKLKLPKLERALLVFPLFLFFVLLIPNLNQEKISLSSDVSQIKKEILQNPNRPEVHLKLAQLYQDKNDLENAKKELFLALSLNPDFQEAKKVLEKIRNLEEEPEKIKDEIKNWEEILKEKPGHRDIYFRIAILNWQIYREKEALEAVNKALELDPNFEPAKNFKKLLSE